MCHREDLHPREMVYKGILVYLCSKGEKVGNKPDHFTFMENVAEQEKEKTQLTEKTRL